MIGTSSSSDDSAAIPAGADPRRRWVDLEIVAAGFLPGALAGTQIAGLLFFLNPHLPFSPAPVARAVLLYGVLLGLVSLVLHLPFTWGRRRRARAILPWSLTLVLAVAALSAWAHASTYSYFLPGGINRRLLKLASFLSASAVITFYTVLLHQLRSRRYGAGSKLLIALMAVLSVYLALERREAFKPAPRPTPRATTVEGSLRPHLVVVGLDAATLDAILPLAEMGELPFFARLQQEGAFGNMESIKPAVRTPLWTTLATGSYPYKHGVVGEALFAAPFAGEDQSLSLLPMAVAFDRWGTWPLARRLDARAVRVLRLWEILARLGMPAAVIGWPLAAPPKADLAVLLSERFFRGAADPIERSPADLGERALLFRPQPEELDPGLVAPFGSRPPAVILDSLVQDAWRGSLSEFLLRQGPPVEALFLQLPGLGPVSDRFFAAHAAHHVDGVLDPEVVEQTQLLAAYYGVLDDFLARLWEATPPPRLLAVVSAEGSDDRRTWRKALRALTRGPISDALLQRPPPGVFMLLGDDAIRPGTRLSDVDLVDVVPTLLYGLGFPVGEDLDGTVLTRAFDTTFLARHPLTFVPSYETLSPP
ncbi:MAG: hypothetical protein D6696_14810 [Acidobacteria bacterium]|nr:MAG: hypothetical protein D6696_14810 [Acidobacteriota bacterium]